MRPSIPPPTLARLALYADVVARLRREGRPAVFSHELARLANNGAAQVRRDLMLLGHRGGSRQGYRVEALHLRLQALLEVAARRRAALVGVGHLGRALLTFFQGREQGPAIVVAFDVDPARARGEVAGCPCHPLDELGWRLRELGVSLAVVAVPVEAAQAVAEQLVAAGIEGILSFAPGPLRLPPTVPLIEIDLGRELETLALRCESREPPH